MVHKTKSKEPLYAIVYFEKGSPKVHSFWNTKKSAVETVKKSFFKSQGAVVVKEVWRRKGKR